MDNILMIVGKKDGCEIVYTKNHKIAIQRSKWKSSHLVFELGNVYYRPPHATMKLTRKKFGYVQKTPYLIEMNRFLFFPTLSQKANECIWINYYGVKELKRENNDTVIYFCDRTFIKNVDIDFKYKLPINKSILVNQMRRCKKIHESYPRTAKWKDY